MILTQSFQALRKRLLYLLSVTFLLAISISGKAEQVEISTFEYLPFMSANPIPDKGNGFAVDVTKAAFESVGVDSHFTFYSMNRSRYLVRTGRSYANLGTIAHFVKEESDGTVFPVEIAPLRFVFLYFNTLHDTIDYLNLSELSGYSIGNVRGSATSPILIGSGLEIDWSTSIEQNFKKFVRGRFDLCITEELTAAYLIQKDYPEMKSQISTVKVPITVVPMSMNFFKGQEELAGKFRQGLANIRKNGTYSKLFKLYFGVESQSELRPH